MAEPSRFPRPGIPSSPDASRDERGPSDPSAADHEALRKFQAEGSSPAFSSLTRRYAGLVYGVAMRRLGHHELAEEVTQDVFSILARKAPSVLQKPIPLAAWLHRAAVLQSSQAARRESSRQRAMKSWANHLEITTHTEGAAPVGALVTEIDEILDQLPQPDRELLLARYFEQRSYRDLALRTGRTEAALMQHHHRALEKLSRLFKRRGHQVTTASLAGGLGAPLAGAAPPGLAVACASNAIASATAGGAAPNALLIALTLSGNTPFALLAAAVVLLAATGGFFASDRLLPRAPGTMPSSASTSSPQALKTSSARPFAVAGAGLPASPTWPIPTAAEVIATEGHERLEKLALWLPGTSPIEMGKMLEALSAMEESSTTRAESELILQRWVEVDRKGAFAASRKVEGNTWSACRAWGQLHPKEAWAAMKEFDGFERSNLMRGIAEADPLLARDLLASPEGRLLRLSSISVEDDLARALAKKNPRQALDYAWKNGLSSVPIVLGEWVRINPDAAIDHVLGLTSLRQRSEAIPALTLALFDKHPELIKPMIESMPEGRLKWQTMTNHVRALAASDEAAALQYAREASSPVARAAMQEQLAVSWAKDRPEAAFNLLRELDWHYSGDEYRLPDAVTPHSTEEALAHSKAAIALSNLAGAGHLEGALAVADGVPAGPLRDQALEAIASRWPADRVYELSEWIPSQDSPSVRGTGTRTILRHLLAEKVPDFDAAARWASTLPELTDVQKSPLVDVMKKWLEADSAAARAALDRLDVPDAVRAAVMAPQNP